MSPVLVKVAECKKDERAPPCMTLHAFGVLQQFRAQSPPTHLDELMVLLTCEWLQIATPWFVVEACVPFSSRWRHVPSTCKGC